MFDYDARTGTLTITAGDTVIKLVDRKDATPDQPFFGIAWTLAGVTGPGAPQSVATGFIVQFSEAGNLTVGPICNAIAGGLFLVDGVRIIKVRLDQVSKYCDTTIRPTEVDIVWRVLTSDPTFVVTGSTMTLTNGDTTLQFVYLGQ
jgi:META domain